MPTPRALPRAARRAAGERGPSGAGRPNAGRSDAVRGHVIAPGEKGYHGRAEAFVPGAQKTWNDAHRARDVKVRNQRYEHEDARSNGKALLVGGGIVAGTSLAAGETLRAIDNQENKRMRAQLARPPRQKVAKVSWDRKDPFMPHADKENGAHKVTLLGEHKGPKAPDSRLARVGRWAMKDKNQAKVAGGILAASLVGIPRAVGPALENEELRDKLEARRRRTKVGKGVLVSKRAKDQERTATGSAMMGAGTVASGTGLIAGGIPGAREPSKNKMFPPPIRGKGIKEQLGRKNIGPNAREAKHLGRAGILGFRSAAHQNVIDGMRTNLPNKGAGKASEYGEPSSNYLRGHIAGKIGEEKKVLRGLRTARKASYGLTLGGGALAVAGSRQKQATSKRDERRSGAAGTAGATALGAVGAVGGARGGLEIAPKVINRKIMREYLAEGGAPLKPNEMPVGGDRFPRRSRAAMRGVKGGAALGLTAGSAAGYRLARGKKEETSKSDRQNAAAGASGAGGTLAAVGHYGAKELARRGKQYEGKAIANYERAGRLAPNFGGVKEVPGKKGPWFDADKDTGWLRRPKKMMEPINGDTAMRIKGAAQIKGGPNSARADQVGRLRGRAAQEKHFAEVFQSTSRAVRRARTPGIALASAGSGGLLATQPKKDVGKSREYGYMERRRNKARTTQQVGGAALLAHGASRLQVGRQVDRGVRYAETQGYGREARQGADHLRRGRNQVRRVTGQAEGALRGRVPGFGTALDKIPRKMRPGVVAGAGALLVARGTPAHDERFVSTGRW